MKSNPFVFFVIFWGGYGKRNGRLIQARRAEKSQKQHSPHPTSASANERSATWPPGGSQTRISFATRGRRTRISYPASDHHELWCPWVGRSLASERRGSSAYSFWRRWVALLISPARSGDRC